MSMMNIQDIEQKYRLYRQLSSAGGEETVDMEALKKKIRELKPGEVLSIQVIQRDGGGE